MFGTDASLFVDLFLVALLATLPMLMVAVRLVRRGRIKAHARVMKSCFGLFVLAVLAFEADVHLMGERIRPPRWILTIHLCFAIPALLLWVRQIALARTALENPAPHRARGRLLIAILCATVATGTWLYVATFV